MYILDCTLRDGGYYNNWDFSKEVVEAYLQAVSAAKIDYVELGLRNFPKPEFLGAYAYTTEAHLNTMDLPEGPIYGVMVDAKTILSAEMSVEQAIESLFVPASMSNISLVRVAAHFDEVEESGPIVTTLKKLGYLVGYNLMQAGGKTTETIADKARIVNEWGVVDTLYFADSLGNMDGKEVERIVEALREHWSGALGIHTHNNMSKGLDNTLTASNFGVTWLDTTITGMGRGAGNTQTENLLAVIDKNGSKYNTQPIYDLVIRYFEEMQKDYGWGSNLLYFLGAQNDVHPTYIQNLLSNPHFGTDEIVGAIGYLSQLEGTTSYNGSVLETALSFSSTSNEVTGTDSLTNKFVGKEVLVLANGDTTKQYANAIEVYIREKKPVVLSVNLVDDIDNNLVDFFVLSHNSKFLSDSERYKKLSKKVILPKHRFSDDELSLVEHLDVFDVGFDCNVKVLSTDNTIVKASYDLTSAYVLGLLVLSSPDKVNLVGFDGYEKGDTRHQEMLEIIQQYHSIESAPKLVSLTPTSYPIQQGSIYAIHS
ncbi:aldolase catalytic domain-containing protein [Vibrio breoganii]